MKPGYFITIEGGEGAGKTSAIRKIGELLKEKGYEVITTREPGGIPIAEKIRGVVLDPVHTSMDGRTEALLYAAARRQHLVEKVIPALQAGKAVLCDRFVDSSLAYQGHARGLGIPEVLRINEFAIEGWMPDLTILMDVSPEVGLARIDVDRGREVNRLDMETHDFHRRVREGYYRVKDMFPERIRIVNADLPMEQVFESLAILVNQNLPSRV
ncbi:dTMP kinase [Paenibacillus sp. GD4]|uniref:dTMP kinase n=1 Tax=Paenibacillus sp. GD4 TaxID=3068890 RepID=UPI0027968944|nr:dTMP kinase [Paenibacillus sp. GD4]MDQ1910970.1 dTMP kinase [Paenibacillus sp. GD4]